MILIQVIKIYQLLILVLLIQEDQEEIKWILKQPNGKDLYPSRKTVDRCSVVVDEMRLSLLIYGGNYSDDLWECKVEEQGKEIKWNKFPNINSEITTP